MLLRLESVTPLREVDLVGCRDEESQGLALQGHAVSVPRQYC